MGYTHYWDFKKKPSQIENGKKKFANAVNNFKKGLQYLPKEVELAGWNGEGEPTITDDKVSFNGKVPLDNETCAMALESSGFDFCKTARKPYDPAVCLLLLCMADEFGDDFTYYSDGNTRTIKGGWGEEDIEIDEGWRVAKEIFAEL